jgi:hypothetical protein
MLSSFTSALITYALTFHSYLTFQKYTVNGLTTESDYILLVSNFSVNKLDATMFEICDLDIYGFGGVQVLITQSQDPKYPAPQALRKHQQSPCKRSSSPLHTAQRTA